MALPFAWPNDENPPPMQPNVYGPRPGSFLHQFDAVRHNAHLGPAEPWDKPRVVSLAGALSAGQSGQQSAEAPVQRRDESVEAPQVAVDEALQALASAGKGGSGEAFPEPRKVTAYTQKQKWYAAKGEVLPRGLASKGKADGSWRGKAEESSKGRAEGSLKGKTEEPVKGTAPGFSKGKGEGFSKGNAERSSKGSSSKVDEHSLRCMHLPLTFSPDFKVTPVSHQEKPPKTEKIAHLRVAPENASTTFTNGITTLMMSSVPMGCTVEDLLHEIFHAGFAEGFDFFYLPTDFATKHNKGYAFINLRSTPLAQAFAVAFQSRFLQCTNTSRDSMAPWSTPKPLVIQRAQVQGFEAICNFHLHRHKSRVNNPWFRPMIFLPGDGPFDQWRCWSLNEDTFQRVLESRQKQPPDLDSLFEHLAALEQY